MKKRIQSLRAQQKKGVSMGIVVCICALLMAFALVIIHTGSMMMATANQKLEEERCYQLARSFSQVLEQQLLDQDSDSDASFSTFAKSFMDSVYPEYDPDRREQTVYSFQMKDALSEEYGQVTVSLYKEATDDSAETEAYRNLYSEGAEGGNYTEKINELQEQEHCRYTIFVEVTVDYQDVSYSYTTEYDCMEQLKPRFYHNGIVLGWNGTNWTQGEELNAEAYLGDITNENPVQYNFRTDSGGILKRYFKTITYEWDNAGGQGS